MVEIEFNKRNNKRIREISQQKANEIIRKYKRDGIEVKELAEAEQVLISIGGMILGYFAIDIANRIAQELNN
ncbi:Uncharacterised protein [uncultured archaeon]|nr:Uncharacterised protein [uncultured archaeon]